MKLSNSLLESVSGIKYRFKLASTLRPGCPVGLYEMVLSQPSKHKFTFSGGDYYFIRRRNWKAVEDQLKHSETFQEFQKDIIWSYLQNIDFPVRRF